MENTTTQLHDFGDGNGEVPAHRHLNPDGLLGYWVPDTWDVGPDVFVYLNVTKAHRPLNELFYIKMVTKQQLDGWANVFDTIAR